jgi:ABC-type branched-subunit amino acid transport system substrate-binding protein
MTSSIRPGWLLGVSLALLVSQSAHGGDLVVGMSAAFRGPSRGLSIELYRGSSAYFEHVNRAGGVHGRKIRILAYDDGYNPIPAIENTIRLVEKDDVFLLFDYMGSPTVTRVLPLLKKFHDNERHVYLFFPFTGAEPQRQFPYNEFVFNLRASYHQETAALVEHFLQLGRTKIAVFFQVDAYGRSGWDGARRTLAEHDQAGKRLADSEPRDSPRRLKMVAEASYLRGSTFESSFLPQVEILRKANPDAVISVGTYSACAAFVRDARDAGWNVPIANLSGVDSENLLALLVQAGQTSGKDYLKNLINSQVVPSYDRTSLPAIRQYRELMTLYHPVPPPELLDEPYTPPQYSYISCEGFLNAKVLVEILGRLGPKPDQARIREVVEGLTDFDLGIDVPISFGPFRHQGMDKVYSTVVADGRFVPLAEEDWRQWRK